jgi:transposase
VRVVDVARRRGLIPHQLFDWRRHARQGLLSLPADLLPALPQADEGSAEPAFVPLAIAPDAIAVLDATAFPEAAGLSLGVIAVEIGADIVLG